MTKYYTLIDAVEMNRLYPETFFIPSDSDIATLKVGDCVKLFFVPTPEANERGVQFTERMWVEIIDADAARGDSFPIFFAGRLVNTPFAFDGVLNYDDFVAFSAWNITAIQRKEQP